MTGTVRPTVPNDSYELAGQEDLDDHKPRAGFVTLLGSGPLLFIFHLSFLGGLPFVCFVCHDQNKISAKSLAAPTVMQPRFVFDPNLILRLVGP